MRARCATNSTAAIKAAAQQPFEEVLGRHYPVRLLFAREF